MRRELRVEGFYHACFASRAIDAAPFGVVALTIAADAGDARFTSVSAAAMLAACRRAISACRAVAR